MESDLVKVVIPTFNRRLWGPQAIESALAQTHDSVHLVLVDDASTDGTTDMIVEYSRRYPDRITAITKTANRGVADSIRLGFSAAPQAPYVALLADDDLWHPTFLERMLERMASSPDVGLMFCEAEVVDDQLAPKGLLFSDIFGRFTTADFADALRGNHASASTLVLRGPLAARVADSMPTYFSVCDYYIILLAAGCSRIGFLDEPLGIYRESESGLHNRRANARRGTTLARHEIFKRNPDLVEQIGGLPSARREVAFHALELAVSDLRNLNWREFAWQSGYVLRSRQLRPVAALGMRSGPSLIDALRATVRLRTRLRALRGTRSG